MGFVFPQRTAGLRVEREEIPVARCREHDAAGGGHHAVIVGTLGELEVPHRFAGVGIECFDARRRLRFAGPRSRWSSASSASDVLLSRFEHGRRADVLLSALVVFKIEPAGERAVGRRLKIRRAADRGINKETSLRTRIRSRRLNGAAIRVEAVVPVLIHERCAG